MTGKRYYIDKSGDLYDKETNSLLVLDFGYSYDGVVCKRIVDLLNSQDNQIRELEQLGVKDNGYSEKSVRKAVEMTASKYLDSSAPMSFNEMVIVENVLMTFEMFLFNGYIKEEDLGGKG